MVTESKPDAPATPSPPATSSGPSRLFTDPRLLVLPERTRLTALGLWHQHVDASGVGPADPTMVRESVWPATSSVTDDDVLDDVVTLGDAGWLALVDGPRGAALLQLADWPSPHAPAPPSARTGHLNLGVVGGKEGRGEGERGQAPPPPTASGPVPLSTTLGILAAMPEPSPFCSQHQPWGSDEKCGPCGGARKRHDLWSQANKESR